MRKFKRTPAANPPFKNPLASSLVREIEDSLEYVNKKDVKLLMDSSSNEELEILRNLKLDKELLKRDKLSSFNETRERLQVPGFLPPINREELADFAMKHNLKLMHTSEFQESLPKDTGRVLLDFVKALKSPSVSHESTRFYVLAPEFSFKNKSIWKLFFESAPIIIYRHESRDNGYWYTPVYGWGEGSTFMRRLLGFVNSKKFSRIEYYLMTRVGVFGALGLLGLCIAKENVYFLLAALVLTGLTIFYFASRDHERSYSNNKEITYSDYWDEIRGPHKGPWFFIRTGYENEN